MARIELTFSVSGRAESEVERTAEALRAAGLEVTAVLDQIAIITGSADESSLEAISRVPGVTHIERQGRVQIAPPGSSVQ